MFKPLEREEDHTLTLTLFNILSHFFFSFFLPNSRSLSRSASIVSQFALHTPCTILPLMSLYGQRFLLLFPFHHDRFLRDYDYHDSLIYCPLSFIGLETCIFLTSPSWVRAHVVHKVRTIHACLWLKVHDGVKARSLKVHFWPYVDNSTVNAFFS